MPPQHRAEELLQKHGVAYEPLDGADPTRRAARDALWRLSRVRGEYPQFFVRVGEAPRPHATSRSTAAVASDRDDGGAAGSADGDGEALRFVGLFDDLLRLQSAHERRWDADVGDEVARRLHDAGLAGNGATQSSAAAPASSSAPRLRDAFADCLLPRNPSGGRGLDGPHGRSRVGGGGGGECGGEGATRAALRAPPPSKLGRCEAFGLPRAGSPPPMPSVRGPHRAEPCV